MLNRVKLEDICTIKGRIGYRGYAKQDLVDEGDGAISLSPSNIKNNKLIFKKTTYISWKKYEESPEIMIYPGDIIFCKTASVGKMALVESLPEKATLNPQFVVLKNIKCSNKFLFYCMMNNDFQKQIRNIVGGSAIPTLSQKNLGETFVFLPPLTEQQRIVAKLDAAFTEIDEKSENINKNIKNAEELKNKFISKQLSKLNKSDLKKLSSACNLTRGPFGGSLTKAMFIQDGYAVYEQKHAIRNNFETIKYFINEKKFNEMKRFELKSGDLLMSCSGTLGKIAIVPKNIKRGIINQALLKITPNKSIISKEYLRLIISSDYFQKILWSLSDGAAQTNVPSVKILKNILIPVPSIEKQEEILKKILILNNLKLEDLYNQKNNLTKLLKLSILSNFINLKNKAA